MARLIGPDAGDRLAVRRGGGVAASAPVVVYAAASGSTLADILTEAGDPVTGSTLTTDEYGLIPLFQFPDGLVDTVYVEVQGGARSPVYARYDDRVDGLVTRVAALEADPGGSVVTIDADGTLVVDGVTVEVATDAQLSAHDADTTAVHGIADTSLLLTQAAAAGTYAPLASPAFTGSPTVNGSPIGVGAGLTATAVKTANYTASATDLVRCNSAAGGFTVTLPTGPATNALVGVEKESTDGNAITVTPAGGGTINGDASATIYAGSWVLQHLGSNAWIVVYGTGNAGVNTVAEEGSALTARPTINFVGAGVTAADDAANNRTNVTIPGASGTSGPLAVVAYQPASTSVSTTSATVADVDATHLAITFTVPASGQVIVVMTAQAMVATNICYYSWALRNGSTTVTGSLQRVLSQLQNVAGMQARITYRFLVTGLTPGVALTYKWAHARESGTGTGTIYYGDSDGQALMEVWAA